jgi:hypothetical protein
VEVFEQRHGRLPRATRPHHSADGVEELALPRFGPERRRRPLGIGHAEEVEHERHGVGQSHVEQDHPAGHLVARGALAVLVRHAEVGARQFEGRQ